MNIFRINSITKPVVPQNSHVGYKKFENSEDVFIKTTSAQPCFKGKLPPDKLAQEILNKPELMQKFSNFMTTAFLTLTAIATGKTIADEVERFCNEYSDNDNAENAVENDEGAQATDEAQNSGEITEDKTGAIDSDDTPETKAEEGTEQTTSNAVEVEESDADSTASTGTEEVEEGGTKILSVRQFVFPKKRGHYAEGHIMLKSVSEQLSLPSEEYEKLTAICNATNKKTVTDAEGNVRAGHFVAMEVAKALQEDSANIKQVINDYFDKLNLGNQELLVDNTEIVPGSEDSDSSEINELSDAGNEIPDDNTTLSELRKKRGQGPVVLGKVDLESLGRGKKAREGQEAPKEDNEIKEESDNLTNKGTKAEPFTDPDNQIYQYVAAGTVLNVYDGLKRMLREYETAVFNVKKDTEYVAWAHRPTTALNVKKRNIINEIKNHKDINCFKNINNDNAEIIADVINSDRRFGEYFTIHGAMRLIDRYADFNHEGSLYEQCNNLLDCLEKTIKVGLKKTVNITRTVSDYDKKGNKRYSIKTIFDPSSFDEESKNYFGTYPLAIVLGEYQPDAYEKDFRKKQPIILTVHPGIC